MEQTNGGAGAPRLPAAGVGSAAVVGFAASGAQLASLLLGHEGGSVPAEPPPSGIDGRWVVLSAGGWRSPPLLAAASFAERLAGIRAVPPGCGLLLWARGVHGWGLRGPIRLVRLEAGGSVAACRWLEPRRFARWPGPSWTLELPAWCPWPPVGARLLAARDPDGGQG